MSDVLAILIATFGLAFVVGSTLAMGLGLTSTMIVQPLKNSRLVIGILLANFVVVPVVIIGLSSVAQWSDDIKIGMFILALAAGAPMVPKMAQFAKANVAVSIGTMILLMVATFIVLPIVLPLTVPEVKIDPWVVAQPLIFLMLVPLVIGLLIRSRYGPFAEHVAPILDRVSSISIIISLFLFFAAFWDQVIATFNNGAVVYAVFFEAFALLIGYYAGGRDPSTRRVLGIATAQRNISAGILLAATVFVDRPIVGVTVLLVPLIGMVILMIATGEWGRRGAKERSQGVGGGT